MFKYGSTLILETVRPKVFIKRPQLEAIMPFPTPEITPEHQAYQSDEIFEGRGTSRTGEGKKNTPPETRMYFILSRYRTGQRSASNVPPWLTIARGGREKKKKKEGPEEFRERKKVVLPDVVGGGWGILAPLEGPKF